MDCLYHFFVYRDTGCDERMVELEILRRPGDVGDRTLGTVPPSFCPLGPAAVVWKGEEEKRRKG